MRGRFGKRLPDGEAHFIEPQHLSVLRASNWSAVPSSPGVYWWYFPLAALECLRIAEFCDVDQLRLRRAPDDKVCLYHGMASNLAERIEWHAAQKLTLSCLKSGFLSTFRFTLLALNDFDYSKGAREIDEYFDDLSVSWQATSTRHEAEAAERVELQGAYHYPLNIQGNKCAELSKYLRSLRAARSAYKARCLDSSGKGLPLPGATVYLVSCVSKKQEEGCAARDLYASDWYHKARHYVQATKHAWFILSAEYGLVVPDQVIAPYERTLNKMPIAGRREWAKRVAEQLAEAVPNLSHAVFLAGARYREFLAPRLVEQGITVSTPMEGLRIGEQLRWLCNHSPPSVK